MANKDSNPSTNPTQGIGGNAPSEPLRDGVPLSLFLSRQEYDAARAAYRDAAEGLYDDYLKSTRIGRIAQKIDARLHDLRYGRCPNAFFTADEDAMLRIMLVQTVEIHYNRLIWVGQGGNAADRRFWLEETWEESPETRARQSMIEKLTQLARVAATCANRAQSETALRHFTLAYKELGMGGRDEWPNSFMRPQADLIMDNLAAGAEELWAYLEIDQELKKWKLADDKRIEIEISDYAKQILEACYDNGDVVFKNGLHLSINTNKSKEILLELVRSQDPKGWTALSNQKPHSVLKRKNSDNPLNDDLTQLSLRLRPKGHAKGGNGQKQWRLVADPDPVRRKRLEDDWVRENALK